MPSIINLCIIILNMTFIIIYVIYLFKARAFTMNAEPLTHQPLFKAALIIPITSFFLLGSIVWIGHGIKLDTDGFNNFLNISKLPLAVLSLSIPLGVVVNNIHRTIQTDKQIKEAQRKNTIDGFYAHRKNTIEIIEKIELQCLMIYGIKYQMKFNNSYSCYKAYYPSASQSKIDFTPSINYIAKLEILWMELASWLHKADWRGPFHFYTRLNAIELSLLRIHEALMLKELDNNELYAVTFDSEDNGLAYEFSTLFRSEKDLKMNISGYWHAHLSLMELFEHEFSDEFTLITYSILEYVQNDEERFRGWRTNRVLNATTPQVAEYRIRK